MRIKLVHESFKTTSHSIFNDTSDIKEIKTAKNQDASFQILLELDKKSAINISSTIGYTQNLRLPRIRVCINSKLEHTILNQGFLKDENEVEYADLLSKTPIMVHPTNRLSAVWVDLHIEKDTPTGLYPVEVRLYQSVANSDEVIVYSETIQVEVLDYCLPDPKDYQMHLDLWQHNSNIARYYEVPLWSDEHFRILEEVTKSLALLGQKSIMILASEAPWNGWGSYIMSKDNTNLFEHSIIELTKTKENKLVCDFSAMQRYIDLCFKYNIKGDISLYGLLGVWVKPLYPHLKIKDYPEPLQIRYYDETNGSYKYLKDKAELYNELVHLENKKSIS